MLNMFELGIDLYLSLLFNILNELKLLHRLELSSFVSEFFLQRVLSHLNC